jgi:hypothetical protein
MTAVNKMYEKWIGVLLKCQLFKGMNTDELKGVLSCLKPKMGSYARNEYVTVVGGKMIGLGVVLSGDVVVSKENIAGNRVIIAVNGPGEMFGDIIKNIFFQLKNIFQCLNVRGQGESPAQDRTPPSKRNQIYF